MQTGALESKHNTDAGPYVSGGSPDPLRSSELLCSLLRWERLTFGPQVNELTRNLLWSGQLSLPTS